MHSLCVHAVSNFQTIQVWFFNTGAKPLADLRTAQNDALRKGQEQLRHYLSSRFRAVEEGQDRKKTSQEINDKIMAVLCHPNLPKHVVGLEKKVQNVLKLLGEGDSNILGVVGMGGAGTMCGTNA